MGNLTTKEASADVCLNYFVRYLQEKQNYVLQSFPATSEGLLQLVRANISATTILQFGDLYFFRLTKSGIERARAEDCMLEPFIIQLCSGKHLDPGYAVDSFTKRLQNDSMVLVICYSQLNWCRVVGTLIVNFTDTGSGRLEPEIDILCSHSPNTDEAMRRLEAIHNVNCDKEPDSFKCLQLQKKALKMTRLGLGVFLMYFALNILAAERKFSFVMLECEEDLVGYYESLGFMLGATPRFALPSRCITGQRGRYTMDIIKRNAKTFFVNQVVTAANERFVSFEGDQGLVRMFYDLNKFRRDDFRELVLKYRPNILNVLNSSIIFTVNDDMINVTKAISDANCISSYFSPS